MLSSFSEVKSIQLPLQLVLRQRDVFAAPLLKVRVTSSAHLWNVLHPLSFWAVKFTLDESRPTCAEYSTFEER